MRTLDIAKRLLDHGFHAPTVYFPLTVDEAMLIEPTETESIETLDAFADALIAIAARGRDRARGRSSRRPTPRPCGGSTKRARRGNPNLRWRPRPATGRPVPTDPCVGPGRAGRFGRISDRYAFDMYLSGRPQRSLTSRSIACL